jgi:hypothetical protein
MCYMCFPRERWGMWVAKIRCVSKSRWTQHFKQAWLRNSRVLQASREPSRLQFPGGNDLPARIAPDAFPQCLHDSGGPALLFKAQHGVDHQQGAHHGQVRIVSQHGRQNHDQFEHPRRDAPEFPKGT